MKSQCPAPVVLSVYARLAHTRRTVEALASNELAAETPLIVFADGSKGAADVRDVAQVRAYVRSLRGFASVEVHESQQNKGLADSIVQGVTAVVGEYGRAIVVEDDLVTSRFFLRYMNDALERYAHEERVMHVAAHMVDITAEGLPETFFLRQSSCWGWATWDRAWKYFSRDSRAMVEAFSADDIRRFNLDGAYDYWGQLLANHRGELRTWAVYWYASIFRLNGLCLYPRQSLVQNIGFDGSGSNCGNEGKWSTTLQEQPLQQFPDALAEHAEAMRRCQDWFRNGGTVSPILSRTKMWWNHFARLLGRSQEC